MALFGAPLDMANQRRAMDAALEMRTALEALNTELFPAASRRCVSGVGIHTAHRRRRKYRLAPALQLHRHRRRSEHGLAPANTLTRKPGSTTPTSS